MKIKWWDSVLHTFSGMIIALLSFSLINLLNKNSKGFQLNIGFAALFAFSLAVSIGVIWEIIEFVADVWFGTNMQRAYVSTMNGRGAALVGQSALTDTMKDLILDSIGAGVVCLVCIIAVCKNKIKIEDLSFIRKKKKVIMMDADGVGSLENKITKGSGVEANNDVQENIEIKEDLQNIEQKDSSKKKKLAK